MAAAELDKLRNVGILGQGGSGKTSLGEAMLFEVLPGVLQNGICKL